MLHKYKLLKNEGKATAMVSIALNLTGMHHGVEHEGGRVEQGFEPPAECSA